LEKGAVMDYKTLSEYALFHHLSAEDISSALSELRALEKQYNKGAIILSAGHTTEYMGLVLSGSVTVQSNDLWGNRTILSHVCKGDYFAGTFSWLYDEVMLVDVVANEDCRILFLDVGRLRSLAAEQYPWTANLLTIAARKNLMLTGRIFHTTPKSARARIMAYLNSVSLQKQSREFDIPFDRQQLADYLNLDRSAMSKELGRMRDEGLIQAKKKHFVLL
jgi:CRP-like cAMP-binding protein